MKWLFVKRSLEFPRRSGHDVHTYEVMRALGRAGHVVSLATLGPLAPGAGDGLDLARHVDLSLADVPEGQTPRLTWLQQKFRSYWGIPDAPIRRVGALADAMQADATVVSGLDVLPLLAGVKTGLRIWYAGDEWVRHHLSLVRLAERETWPHLRTAAIKGCYERAYAPLIDRAWVVTPPEAVAMRRYAGVKDVDVLPNGVDVEHFRPLDPPAAEEPDSACFWGRLDFEPNIDALRWFLGHVWPLVRLARPSARFVIYGFQPGDAVRAWDGRDGIAVRADMPDLRAAVQGQQVVVLPFVSGGGIKNKLLEAAALGRPIVASPVALEGLEGVPPLVMARTPSEWASTIVDLMADPEQRARRGREARAWVRQAHSWDSAVAAVVSAAESHA